MKLFSGYKTLLLSGFAALVLSVPAYSALQGQDNEAPESLLPPGFGDPPPANPRPLPKSQPKQPTPPAKNPAKNSPDGPAPATPKQNDPLSPSPDGPDKSGDTATVQQLPSDDTPSASSSEPSFPRVTPTETATDTSEDFLPPPTAYDLPSSARRSLKQVGVIGENNGGLAADSFDGANGKYAITLLRNMKAPLISRWGSIMLRRALVSRTVTPESVNGADWVAARSALLLQMGESDNARLLVENVDTPQFTPALYTTALNAFLATADPSGICPLVAGGTEASDDVKWEMSKAICSALSGEQSSAVSRIDRMNRNDAAPKIDLLLAEKTIGAGTNGRRAVTILWDDVDTLTPWRYGLALATGIEPPVELFRDSSVQYQGWRLSAPMLSLESRIEAADTAAAMGVLSSRAMIDLYGAAYDSEETGGDLRARASTLRGAYGREDVDQRLEDMQSLWNRSENPVVRYSSLILTSHAAARFPVSKKYADDSSQLIASMLSAGLDRNAIRWASVAPIGSDGWAMLVLGTPSLGQPVAYSSLDSYYDGDGSEDARKSAFLLAGLSGLSRVSDEDRESFEDDLDITLASQSKWAKAIDKAAADKQVGLVVILSAAGMQGSDWSQMSPSHLFHIVRALRSVGLVAEARMIAAEAIARG